MVALAWVMLDRSLRTLRDWGHDPVVHRIGSTLLVLPRTTNCLRDIRAANDR